MKGTGISRDIFQLLERFLRNIACREIDLYVWLLMVHWLRFQAI